MLPLVAGLIRREDAHQWLGMLATTGVILPAGGSQTGRICLEQVAGMFSKGLAVPTVVHNLWLHVYLTRACMLHADSTGGISSVHFLLT